MYHFGRIRRSDWLPVGGSPGEQISRSAESDSDDEFDEVDREMEDLYSGSESDIDDEEHENPRDHEASDDGYSEPSDYEPLDLAGAWSGGDPSVDLGGLL